MKIKTSTLTGAALDWAVVKCKNKLPLSCGNWEQTWPKYSTDWAQGGPIIEREDISVIRCKDESIPDAKGFWRGKYEPRWAAVSGDRHSREEIYGSQGDNWGSSYKVDEDAVVGPTALTAAMRCYVACKLGDEVEIPDELL